MSTKINSHLVKTKNIASYPLGVLGSIAHPVTKEGVYLGTIKFKKQTVAKFKLVVDSDVKQTQLDIDFANLHRQSQRKATEQIMEYKLNPEGYLMFFVSSGPGGYHVVMDKLTANKPKPTRVFDNKSLSEGDLFILTLLRPGRYEVFEKRSKTVSKVTVAYPKVTKMPFSPGVAVNIELPKSGFGSKSKALKIDPGQGIVLQIQNPKSGFMAKLIKPDDGPKARTGGRSKAKRHSWVNPRAI